LGQEAEVAQWLYSFWLEEEGQDVIEYSLLLAFIVFLCLAFVFSGTTSVHGIWAQSDSELVAANSVTGGS
jgi:Flp pilus assembly pilin Flp